MSSQYPGGQDFQGGQGFPPQQPYNPPPFNGQTAGNFFTKMLNFDTMIGPTLIKVMYYVGLALIVLGGLYGLLQSMQVMRFMPAAGFLTILVVLILIPLEILFWRFACELWMLIFKIHDRLVEIKDKLPG